MSNQPTAQLSLPAPSDFGVPEKFATFRPQQVAALFDTLSSNKRCSGVVIPTGGGKMLYAVMFLLMTNQRGLILTESRGLEDQYKRDLEGCDWYADIRGANNYYCPALDVGGKYHNLLEGREPTCDIGPCKLGLPCKLRNGGCPQYDAIEKAKYAQVVTSNFAYWTVTDGEELGEFDCLINDEGHAVIGAIEKSLAVELKGSIVVKLPSTTADFSEWRKWARWIASGLQDRLEELKAIIRSGKEVGQVNAKDLKDAAKLTRLLSDVQKVATAEGEWVVQQVSKQEVKFDPITVDRYAEKKLFRNIPRIIVMSATLQQQVFGELGVGEGEYDFYEYDSSFPIESRPVYVLPYVPVQFNMSESDLDVWVGGIDAISSSRDDRKGLIHSVSYNWARKIFDRSKYKDRLWIIKDGRDTAKMLKEFARTKEPVIAVHPAIYTGYDFPLTAAEFQIQAKLHMVDLRDPIVKAKKKRDKEWPYRLCMEKTQQMAGRIVRSLEGGDRGETFVIDGHAGWFLVDSKGRHSEYVRKYATKSFAESLKRVSYIPKAPPSMLRSER